MKFSIWSILPERFFDPDRIYGLMINFSADPMWDTGTFRIASFLAVIDGVFGKTFLTRFYLRRWKMFNASLVEGTGMVIYLAMVPFFLKMFLPWGVTIAWWITTVVVAPCSFLAKYIFYDRWLFKKVDNRVFTDKGELADFSQYEALLTSINFNPEVD